MVSMALMELMSLVSTTSSKTRLSGSQEAEWLAPLHRVVEEARAPKTTVSWKFCLDFNLHSWETMWVFEVNFRSASGVIAFAFLNADECAPSSCKRWVKPSQCVDLTKWHWMLRKNHSRQRPSRKLSKLSVKRHDGLPSFFRLLLDN